MNYQNDPYSGQNNGQDPLYKPASRDTTPSADPSTSYTAPAQEPSSSYQTDEVQSPYQAESNPYQPEGNPYQPPKPADEAPQSPYTSPYQAPQSPYYSSQNPYQSAPPTYPPHQPQYQPPQPPRPPHHANGAKPPKPPKKGSRIALVLTCMVLSVLCGFGGDYLNSMINPTPETEYIDTTTVLTQSLVNESESNSDVAAVAAATMNSVVEITTEVTTTDSYMQQMVTEGAGSGVIITEDGYIVTCYHVIEGASKITVTTKLGETYDATVVGTDESTDLAVLKIDATDLTAAVLGDSDALVVGELAVAIGNPLGSLGGTVTEGIISALDREITIDDQTYSLLQTSAAINSGNSGGGLFNSQGELIGIVNAKSSGTGIEGLGFAIPINTAVPIIEDLIEYGYVTGQVQLGVSLLSIDDAETATLYRVSNLGVYIAQVTANSDAYYGGLQVGDLICSINGETITTTTQVKEMVTNSEVGDVLSFEIIRSDQTITIDITLTEYNSALDQFVSSVE